MHALHNDQKGNVGTTVMVAYDLGAFAKGMYPDESEGSAALVEQVWKYKGQTHAPVYTQMYKRKVLCRRVRSNCWFDRAFV